MKQPLSPGADGDHVTFCRICEAMCGMVATVKDGRITDIRPDHAHPVSKGHICIKGPGMADVVYDPDRVLTPLRRTGGAGAFTPVSWDEALDDIAARLERIVAQNGPDSVGIYMGNPGAFATYRYSYGAGFVAALGSSHVYNALHVDTGARILASQIVYGHPIRYPFPDLPACDYLMIMGGNPLVSHMSLITVPRVREALDGVARRGKVLVVDPRNTETAKRYTHLPIRPDTDAWLLIGMLKTIFEESLHPGDLDERATGWQSLRDFIAPVSLEDAAARCQIDVKTIRQTARDFATARTAACYGRVGTNRGSFSTLTNVLMDALNILTGRFGAPGGWGFGYSPLETDADSTPPPEHGAQRSRIGNIPLVAGVRPGGAMAAEITQPGPGQIRAFFVDSGNPVMAYPEGDRLQAALETLDLFVAVDFYVTETTKYADYFLPATTFLEREDLPNMWKDTQVEPHLHYTDAVIPPRGEARMEFEIYDAILERMGKPDPLSVLSGATERAAEPMTPMGLADAVLRNGSAGDKYGAAPEGYSIERLKHDFPHGALLEGRRDITQSAGKIIHEDGKPHLWSPLVAAEGARLLASSGPADTSLDLRLFGRRMLKSINSWMHNSDRLVRSDAPTLLMHPGDAMARQINDGQTVRIRSKVGQLDVKVELTDEVIEGSVSYPHAWGHDGGWQRANKAPGVNINLLASADPADWEPISGMCLLDGIAVEVKALP